MIRQQHGVVILDVRNDGSANFCVPGVSYGDTATLPTNTSYSGITHVGGTRPVMAYAVACGG